MGKVDFDPLVTQGTFGTYYLAPAVPYLVKPVKGTRLGEVGQGTPVELTFRDRNRRVQLQAENGFWSLLRHSTHRNQYSYQCQPRIEPLPVRL